MKSLLLLSVAFAGFLPATQAGPVFKPKEGAKASLALDAKFEVGGMEATVVANISTEVKKSDDKMIGILAKWADVKVEAGGNPYPVEVSDGDIELSTAYVPTKISGGVQGVNAAEWFIASHFIPPVGKEVMTGLKYKVEVPAVTDVVPAYTYDGEFVGKEDLDGKPAYKFKGAIKLKAADSLTSSLVALVREDGTVAKVTADFKSLDITAVGQKADGKMTITAKS